MGALRERSPRASRGGVGRRAAAGLALVLLLLLPACGGPAGRLWLDDGATLLNGARVEAAAEPLRARGATVAVVVVATGDDTGADFASRLNAAGLLAGQEIVSEGIAVYVSRTPRYSELRVGRRWSGTIDRESLAAIRREQLNPPLSAGDVTDGVVAALRAVEDRLAVAGASGVPWMLVGPVAGALAVVAVIAAWFWRRHQRRARERHRLAWAAERLAAARQAVAAAATEARAAVEGATRLKPGHRQEYQTRLRRLDQQRARLEEQTPPPATLVDDLTELATSYRGLTEAVRFSLASLTMTASELKNRRRRRAQPPARARYTAASGASASESDHDSSYSSSDSSLFSSSDSSPSSSGGGSESRDGGEY